MDRRCRRDATLIPQAGAVERLWDVRPSAEKDSLQPVVLAPRRARRFRAAKIGAANLNSRAFPRIVTVFMSDRQLTTDAPASGHPAPPADGHCLLAAIAETIAAEPTLEAVTLDRGRDSVSVATLGQADVPRLSGLVTALIQQSQAAAGGSAATCARACELLAGRETCAVCPAQPLPFRRKDVQVRQAPNAVTIARVTCPTAPSFWRWRDIPWPRVVQRDVEFLEHLEAIDAWKPQLAAAIACGAFATAAAWAFGAGTAARSICYLLAYAAGAWYAAQEVWQRAHHGALDVHFLMLAVAAGSASIGGWAEGAILLFLFSLSGALEHFALGRTQREIQALFKHAPKSAFVIGPDGHEVETAIDALQPGMRLLIKPGVQFPVDGDVAKGQTASDESTLTGEAAPVAKQLGDPVFAGTLNLWGAVEVIVSRPAAQSALQRVIHLIREAQQQKAPAQRFTDRFSATYTYVVLALSLAMFFVWWLAVGLPAFATPATGRSAFYHAMTLLVVASPCALVLSIPSAILAAIAWGARRGVLFRGGAAVEKLAEVRIVALDKTGTLTTGELRVERVESFPPGQEEAVARYAFAVERLSTHPVARAITRFGKQQQLPLLECHQFNSVTAQGVEAVVAGVACRLGRFEWAVPQSAAGALPAQLASDPSVAEVWLSRPDVVGRIVLRDDIRPQAGSILEGLRREGLRAVVLTGDRPAAGEHLKRQLDLEDVRSGLHPEQKVEVIRSLSAAGAPVAMIGDGVNDAPSLAAAHVGVAMGARGSDAALEQADVVLMHDRLENFLAAYRLSQRARRIIRQNLVLSLGTVAVLVVFALAGRVPLTLGVIGHEGSTVIVVMNSLRLLFGRSR
jgi:Cd2+/Zn2+-exporting ATPase